MWFIIDDGVLKKCTLLQGETEAVVPEGVKVIGRESFMDCTSLTKVTLPNSVWRIGFMAFRGCTSLVSITLPDNLKVIAEWAFYGCKSLANVTIRGDAHEEEEDESEESAIRHGQEDARQRDENQDCSF